MEFQAEEETKENQQSPNVALLCAGLLRRGMVHELERVLRCVMAFSAACQRHMMMLYCCGSGSANKLFLGVFYLDRKPIK